ncbi:MAG: hypothetical protein OXH14_09270 [Alphaproteobacteria bacterium]|nr:hypothetical protein [Alphaproteobacteria bacterium]
MTEAERLERERNWVKTRFDCTTDAMFKTLVAVIKSDILSFNKLSGNDDCKWNDVDDQNVTFTRKERVSSISTNGRKIRVSIMFNGCNLSRFEIRTQWNDAEMRCDLFIEEELVSMHRASQKIIGDVLFGL